MEAGKIKKGLGRGLSSLIGETKVDVSTNELPVSEIIPNKYQPRKYFDEDSNDFSKSFNSIVGFIIPSIIQ